MTVDEVQARMDEACRTLMRLHVPGCWPASQSRSAWPPFVQDFWERFAALVDPKARAEAALEAEEMLKDVETRKGPPSSAEIDRFDEVLTWFPLVERVPDRGILWEVSLCRSAGFHNYIARVARQYKTSRETVRRKYARALGDIAVAVQLDALG